MYEIVYAHTYCTISIKGAVINAELLRNFPPTNTVPLSVQRLRVLLPFSNTIAVVTDMGAFIVFCGCSI